MSENSDFFIIILFHSAFRSQNSEKAHYFEKLRQCFEIILQILYFSFTLG